MECPNCRGTVVVADPLESRSCACEESQEELEDGLLLELQQLRASLLGTGNDSGTLRGQVEKARDDLQIARDERDQLQEHLAEALADRDTLAARLVMAEELQEILAHQEEHTRRLDIDAALREDEIVSLRNELSALRNEKGELATLLEASEEFGRGASERIADLHRLQGELARNAVSLAELTRQAELARETRSELESHVLLLQVQFEEAVASRKASEMMQQELAQLRSERATTIVWQEENTAMQAVQEQAKQEAAIATASLREETKGLQVRVEHLGNQLQGRDRELDEARQRIRSLERDLSARRETLEQAQKQVEDSWKEREEASRRLAALEIESQASATKLAEAALAERTYRSIIEQTQAAHSAAQRNIEPLRLERDQLRAELASLHSGNGSLEHEMDAIRAERDGLRTSLEHLEAQMEENFEHLRVSMAERDHARMEMEAIRAGLERARQHVAVLQSRRDQMREEIARLKQALGLSVEVAR